MGQQKFDTVQPRLSELQNQWNYRVKVQKQENVVYLSMRGVYCHAAAVHEQWPPELVALKEAKNTSE